MIAMAKLKLDILIKLIMCYKASQLYHVVKTERNNHQRMS